MTLSPFDLAGAKDAVEDLLTRLKLEALRFAVEHTERGWELRVECATDGDWELQTVLLGDMLPAASEADAHLQSRLLALLDEKLAICTREPLIEALKLRQAARRRVNGQCLRAVGMAMQDRRSCNLMQFRCPP